MIGVNEALTAVSADQAPRISAVTPTTKASLSAEVFTRNVSRGVKGILYDFGEDDARLATPFDETFLAAPIQLYERMLED